MERRSFLQWLKSIFHIYGYYNMGPSRWTELDNPHEYQHQLEFMDYDEDEDW